MDAQLGELFERLNRSARYDECLLIVLSDHGEGFGSKSVLQHGTSLYQSQISVPLIIKFPHQTEPAVVQDPVSGVDLLPTVLEAVRLPVPEGLDGSSLLEKKLNRFVLAESYPIPSKAKLNDRFATVQRAIIAERYKLLTSNNGYPELYDLNADPDELENHFDPADRISRELQLRLATWVQGIRALKDLEPLDQETRSRLEALGY